MEDRIELMLLKMQLHIRVWVDGKALISWRSFAAPSVGDCLSYDLDLYLVESVCWEPNDEMGVEQVSVNVTPAN